MDKDTYLLLTKSNFTCKFVNKKCKYNYQYFEINTSMRNFPERLKSARKMNGFSMQELADKMNNVVSKQAIGKYELGVMKPDSEILSAICKALNVRPDYFLREGKITLENVEFRKLTRLSKKDIEKIREQTIDFLERYFELENLLGIDSKFNNPLKDTVIDHESQIEEAVVKLRKSWKIESNHVPNLIKLFEDQGIKVFEIDAPDSFSGLATYVNNSPVVVLNSNLNHVLDRKRFTALHELAHLLLKFSRKFDQKQIEKLCYAFSGAFLMPKELFINEFGGVRHNVFIEELKFMKQNFGISMQAIMARAKNLELISEQYYKTFSIQFSKLGFRKKEPGAYQGYESSNRFFQLLYRAVAEEIISLSKAASLNNQKLADFREMLASY